MPELPTPDTLPQWLYQRFARTANVSGWDDLSGDDQSYWAHHAAAVRRAVARGGFKNRADGNGPAVGEDVFAEFGITDGTSEPLLLDTDNAEDAAQDLETQRLGWTGQPLRLVQRKVVRGAWADVKVGGQR